MTTLAILSDDIGGFQIGAEALGMTFAGQTPWRSEALQAGRRDVGDRCDCLAVSMPSGSRVFGFDTEAGDWIGGEAVARTIKGVVEATNPETLIMYARRALLTDRFGTTFAQILESLSGYSIVWKGINLSWFDIPQDANRVVVMGRRNNRAQTRLLNVIRENLPSTSLKRFVLEAPQNLSELIESRKPRIGRPAPSQANPFGTGGYCISGAVYSASYPILKKEVHTGLLAETLQLSWDLDNAPDLHSVRFTSRRGQKGLSVKHDGLAHSFGPSISAWPLFAVRAGALEKLKQQEAVVQWQSSFDSWDVFRLTPAAAVGLFGKEALPLKEKLNAMKAANTRKYEIGSSTVPPRIVTASLFSLDRHLGSD